MAGGAETPNIAALPAIARLGACESARGPDADRHVKLLIQFAVEGSPSGAHSQSANANLQTSAPNRSSSIKSEQILASWLFGNRNRKVNSLNPLSAAETPFLIECFAYPRALLLQILHRRRYMFQRTPCSRCIPQTVGHQWLVNALDWSLHLSTCRRNNDN